MLTKAKYWREFTALPERLPAYLPAPGDAPHWTVTIFYKGSDPESATAH